MNKITFNDTFVDVHQKDLQAFFSHLLNDFYLSQESVLITVIRYRRNDNTDLMTNIVIEFMTYDKATQLNQKWEWTSCRAKDFCCSNSGFKKVEQFKK